MKTILVTGSAGFIGSNLVLRLFKEMQEGLTSVASILITRPWRSLETPPTPLFRGEPAMDIQMNKILDITINDFKVSLNREI